MILFQCDCGKQLQAREQFAGNLTVCPACGKDVTVPAAGATQAGGGGEDWADDEPPSRDAPAGTSGKATAAFVLGLLSFCLPVLLSLAAILLAILGLADISRGRGRVRGKGLAVAGIVLGCLSVLVVPVGLFFAAQRVREAAARVQDQNNLKQIGLAMFEHQNVYRRLAPPALYDKDGRPLYSWRVLILPFLGEQNLYKQFRLDEPWDSPHNKKFVTRMPKVYAHPLDPEGERNGLTHYQVFVGATTEPGPRPPFLSNPLAVTPCHKYGVAGVYETAAGQVYLPASFEDGTANTILVAQAARAAPWTSPEDLPYSAGQAVPPLGGLFSSGFNVVLADASVRFIDRRTTEQTLRAAITMNGHEELGPDW